MTTCETAVDLFAREFNCAQAILGAYGPAEGLCLDDCLRLAAPFGGGIGRLGETCGAVIGALMVLGLRHGRAVGTDTAAKAALYERAQRFCGGLPGPEPERRVQRPAGLRYQYCSGPARDAGEEDAPGGLPEVYPRCSGDT